MSSASLAPIHITDNHAVVRKAKKWRERVRGGVDKKEKKRILEGNDKRANIGVPEMAS